jgi:hypothetical protein
MALTFLVIALTVMYGIWLYNRRARGVAGLLLAPATWLAIFLLTALVKAYTVHNSLVSGYSHNEAWISMNDNPHPESWEVQYAEEDWPLLIAFIAPIISSIVLRVIDGWQFRHFISLGLFAWIALFTTTCSISNTKEYYNKSELPPIGSRANRSY